MQDAKCNMNYVKHFMLENKRASRYLNNRLVKDKINLNGVFIASFSTVDTPAYYNKILEIHNDAVKNNEYSYIDPATGYIVFTELKAIKRGVCCGMCCRHCPFQYEKVPEETLIGKPPPITTASIPS